MSIISLQYAILVAAAFIIYWIFPKKYRWIILLATSGTFVYLSNGKKQCAIMVGMILVAWIAGIVFDKLSEGVIRQILCIIAVLLDASLIFGVRIINAGLEFASLGGKSVSFISIMAPVGMAYFSLSTISYMLDVYWKVLPAEKNPLKVLLFGSYFPLLTSGPIVRYKETGLALFEEKKFSYDRFAAGFIRILWGLFKKLVISERLAVIVNSIYDGFGYYTGVYLWIGFFAFTMQLYTDFSGCIDIIMGVSELFGISLPENFDLPFASRTLSEFWRKWHITLGAWLKDYILYPILKSSPWQAMTKFFKKIFGKKYGKKVPVWLGLLVSWTLIGIWHGGGLNYIVGVGWWCWLVIVLSEALEPCFKWIKLKLNVKEESFGWKAFQYIRTFVIITLGLSMFRSTDGLVNGFTRIRQAFVYNPWILFNGSIYELGLDYRDVNVLKFGIILIIAAAIIKMITKKKTIDWLMEQGYVFRILVVLGLIFIVVIFGMYGSGFDASAFIYGEM